MHLQHDAVFNFMIIPNLFDKRQHRQAQFPIGWNLLFHDAIQTKLGIELQAFCCALASLRF